MSTNDVPGANPANHDKLAMGCWAEHDDGSLLLVEANEANRVVFSMFDVSKNPIIEYRDARTEDDFKKRFSWKPTGQSTERWTWHDKTPFPWDRVIAKGAAEGPRMASADAILTAAERVAASLHLRGAQISRDDVTPRAADPRQGQDTAGVIMDKLHRAFNELLR